MLKFLVPHLVEVLEEPELAVRLFYLSIQNLEIEVCVRDLLLPFAVFKALLKFYQKLLSM